MSQRERKLAIAVGALAVIVVGFFAFTWWDGKVDDQHKAINALRSTVSEQDDQIEQAARAHRQLEAYRARSLPGDIDVARSLYRNWLLDLAVKQVKLSQPLVTPGSITPVSFEDEGVTYRKLSFSVRGQGTLEQLTDMMFDFYSVDTAHQIRTLDVKPIADSRLLDITLGIDALVVEGAAKSDSLAPKQIAAMDAPRQQGYRQAILGRNVFAPANRPPQVSKLSPQRITTKDSLSLDLKATDADPLDKVSFELGEGAPEGASVDRTGKLRFRSAEKGSYQIPVIARDDGVPSASTQVTVSVSVVDPPPQVVRTEDKPAAQAHFEDGQFAFVTAITEVNGRRQLWLNDRTTGETSRLYEGDAVKVKRLSGVVSRIGLKEVEVTSLDERRRFQLGENLAQGEKLPAPAGAASGDGE